VSTTWNLILNQGLDSEDKTEQRRKKVMENRMTGGKVVKPGHTPSGKIISRKDFFT
jgi:hypothetical protein